MRQADKLKKAGCILLVTTMIAALTGCSQKAPEPEAAPQQEAANAPAEAETEENNNTTKSMSLL